MAITTKLQLIIERFEAAQEKLDEADSELSAELAPILKETNDISDLLKLSRSLPLGFFGARFVYEKIADLSKQKGGPNDRA